MIELLFSRMVQNNNGDGIVNELNTRFKTHEVGYQFTLNQITRINSELTHQEIKMQLTAFIKGEK